MVPEIHLPSKASETPSVRQCCPTEGVPLHRFPVLVQYRINTTERSNQARSKRSRFITLVQAATKSCTNFS